MDDINTKVIDEGSGIRLLPMKKWKMKIRGLEASEGEPLAALPES